MASVRDMLEQMSRPDSKATIHERDAALITLAGRAVPGEGGGTVGRDIAALLLAYYQREWLGDMAKQLDVQVD
jgi:hypothetical protein